MHYFNKYGLFHISLPVLVCSILLYNMFEDGFDLLFAGVWFAFIMQIFISAYFAQFLSRYVTIVHSCSFGLLIRNLFKANDFYLGVYDLNWTDFGLEEQKAVRMILMRSQATISITLGSLYEYNFALVTKVVQISAPTWSWFSMSINSFQILKLQVSICAVLQTI